MTAGRQLVLAMTVARKDHAFCAAAMGSAVGVSMRGDANHCIDRRCVATIFETQPIMTVPHTFTANALQLLSANRYLFDDARADLLNCELGKFSGG